MDKNEAEFFIETMLLSKSYVKEFYHRKGVALYNLNLNLTPNFDSKI